MSTKTHETGLIKFGSVFYLPSFVACHEQNAPPYRPQSRVRDSGTKINMYIAGKSPLWRGNGSHPSGVSVSLASMSASDVWIGGRTQTAVDGRADSPLYLKMKGNLFFRTTG
jgi:hypothetical protein